MTQYELCLYEHVWFYYEKTDEKIKKLYHCHHLCNHSMECLQYFVCVTFQDWPVNYDIMGAWFAQNHGHGRNYRQFHRSQQRSNRKWTLEQLKVVRMIWFCKTTKYGLFWLVKHCEINELDPTVIYLLLRDIPVLKKSKYVIITFRPIWKWDKPTMFWGNWWMIVVKLQSQ